MFIGEKINTVANNVYDVHSEQKLATQHTSGRSSPLKRKNTQVNR